MPTEFDVGAHAMRMIYAVTEGEEKPPLPHPDFDLDAFLANLEDANPEAVVFQVRLAAARASTSGVRGWKPCAAALSPTAAAG